VGLGLDRQVLVTGAALKIDTTLLKFLGPIAPQVEFFGASAANDTYLDKGSVFGGGLGLRLRLFNDEQGYLVNPGTKRKGNLWGNLWIDAHVTLNSGGFGVGFDSAVGAELSLLEGLSIGPFAKFMFLGRRPVDLGPQMMALFGLSITIGAPQTTPDEADYDGDPTTTATGSRVRPTSASTRRKTSTSSRTPTAAPRRTTTRTPSTTRRISAAIRPKTRTGSPMKTAARRPMPIRTQCSTRRTSARW
jgi:hypothetical protein